MTESQDTESNDRIPFSRRGILQAIGAAGTIGALGANTATAEQPNEFVVGVEHRRADVARQRANSVKRVIDFGPDIGEAVAGRWPEEALEGLRNNPHVRYVEENGAMEPLSHPAELQWGVDRVDAEVAHANGDTGSGVDVAVLDTGIDPDHDDLEDNLGTGHSPEDCRDTWHPGGSCDEDWADDDGHGTHVAGIAGAIQNDDDVVGVSPDVTLHSVKVCRQRGDVDGDGDLDPTCPDDSVADGIKTAANEGYDVINLSLGACCPSCGRVGDGTGDCDDCKDVPGVIDDAIRRAKDEDVVIVSSAGNDGNRPDCDGDGDAVCDDNDCVGTPAKHSDVIAVSSTADDDDLSGFSSVGSEVDLAAPGSAIVSTWNDGTTNTLWGTSQAAPHVAGAAAQLLANGTSPGNVRSVLKSNAEDIGLASYEQGAGLLDLSAALGHDSANDLTEVETRFAADIQYTEVELNGQLTELTGNDDAEVFFEYREAGAGSWTKTATKTLSGTGGFEELVTGLAEDTAYEFRAGVTVEEPSEGWSSTEHGEIETFDTVDNPDPTASFTHDPEVPDPGDAVEFDASGSDPGEVPSVDEDDSIVEYAWDFGDGTTATTTDPIIEHRYSDPSDVTVSLQVTDEFDQTDETTETLRVNAPPEAAFDHTPTLPNEDEPVEFDASASVDPDGDVVEYEWDFGDGNTATTSDPVVEHTYAIGDYGNQDVTLTVTDNDDATDAVTQTIRVNAVPEADFAVVTDPPVRDEPVEFDASASADRDPEFGGEIDTYEWDFGDGTTATTSDPVVEHTFATGGEQTVRLRVTDDDGASHDDLSVHEETFTVYVRVAIDVKPGGDPNPVNPNQPGEIPVAVLHTSAFDPPGRLDHSSVRFGDPDDVGFDTSTDPFTPDGGATPAHSGGHVEDVDDDGDEDSLFHFPTRDADFESDDTEGKLVGLTNDGVPVFGTDSVNVVGGGRP